MLGVGGCLFLSGCSNDVTTVEGNGVLPILFSVNQTGTATEVHTKSDAPATFPNSGKIAVIAAKSNSVMTPTDWSKSNLYLNHVAATAGIGTVSDVIDNGVTTKVTTYPVTLNTTAYWPFNPNEYLEFVAYSPAEHLTLSHDENSPAKLTVSADGSSKNFFDLLYTTPTAAYNKASGKDGAVSLGEFQHAMAALVVKVTPIDAITLQPITGDAIKDLKIAKLNVQTKVTTGELNISSGTPTWVLTNPANGAAYITSKTLISSNTSLPYNSEKEECYLFPATTEVNTVELSRIEFMLMDGSITSVDTTYDIKDFKQTPSGESVKLEMGKTTVLNIKVKVTSIQTGEDNKTTLEGTLVDWIYKGNSSVTIE